MASDLKIFKIKFRQVSSAVIVSEVAFLNFLPPKMVKWQFSPFFYRQKTEIVRYTKITHARQCKTSNFQKIISIMGVGFCKFFLLLNSESNFHYICPNQPNLRYGITHHLLYYEKNCPLSGWCVSRKLVLNLLEVAHFFWLILSASCKWVKIYLPSSKNLFNRCGFE